jgi:DNA-binding HxlR family transcriptional regulator
VKKRTIGERVSSRNFIGYTLPVLQRTYENQNCSIARTLELVGERWTLLIIRDVFLGLRRFDQLQQSLDVARNVLSGRLARLVEAGILERVRYQERPERHEYRLTEKGLDLFGVLVALMKWGDRWYAPAGPPRVLRHRDCGGRVSARLMCSACGETLEPAQVRTRTGPGYRAATAA